jgi:hypothetical protein
MAIRVLRLSPSTNEFRVWGHGNVEVHGTSGGVTIEFTRRMGRGSSTFQIVFDKESVRELANLTAGARAEDA